MPDEQALREKARAAVRNGKIPSRRPDRTWGATALVRPAPSATCRSPRTRCFARDGDNPGLDKFHVHIRCFAAWEFERVRP